jgi:hypothetical protein
LRKAARHGPLFFREAGIGVYRYTEADMAFTAKGFNENQERLRKAMKDGDLSAAIDLMLAQNAAVHSRKVSQAPDSTLEDIIWEKGEPELFRSYTAASAYSAAWHLWHSARIEDICSHAFFDRSEQVLDAKGYGKSMGVKWIDTGNSFGQVEMEKFNKTIDLAALREYRAEVGKHTRRMMKKIKNEDLQRRVDQEALDEIARRGYVDQKSAWLLDFWGRKRMAGIVGMPLTRHLMVHLNQARLKLKIR